MTNLEKIRSMSAEELAYIIAYKPRCTFCAFNKRFCSLQGLTCTEGITKWLNEEADNG